MSAPTEIPAASQRQAHRNSLYFPPTTNGLDPRSLSAHSPTSFSPLQQYRRSPSISMLASGAYSAAAASGFHFGWSDNDAHPLENQQRAPSLCSTQSTSTASTSTDEPESTLFGPSSPTRTLAPAPRDASSFNPTSLRQRDSTQLGRRFSVSSWLGLDRGKSESPTSSSTAVLTRSPTVPVDKHAALATWEHSSRGTVDLVPEHTVPSSGMLTDQGAAPNAPARRGRPRSKTTGFRLRRPSPRGERFLMGQLDMQ